MSKLVAARADSRLLLLPLKIVVLLLVYLVPGPRNCNGQIDWNNPVGNSWYDFHANWAGGVRPGSTDTARFGLNATYNVWWDSVTEGISPDVGRLNVNNGQVTFWNYSPGGQWSYTINGSGGPGAQDDVLISGANTSLSIRGMHVNNLGGTQLANGATFNIEGSHVDGTLYTSGGSIGFDIGGHLNVISGGRVDSTESIIGRSSGDVGIATVSGVNSSWDNSSTLGVGIGGTGTLNVQSGGFVSNSFGVLGEGSSGIGTVNVSGAGSRWHSFGSAYVGLHGQGTLNVENGGIASSLNGRIGLEYGSSGVANISGVDSQWNISSSLDMGAYTAGLSGGAAVLNISDSGQVHVGDDRIASPGTGLMIGRTNGTTSLNVFTGAKIYNSGAGYIGYNSTTNGIATVHDTGSEWNNTGDLLIGYEGTGTLNIGNGGVVNNANGTIGDNASGIGTVAVSGSGSQWNNTGALLIGYQGTGTLNIENGGVVNNANGTIGYQPTGIGTVVVTGTGSQWNSTDLYLGRGGDADLEISNGGLVNSSNAHMAHSSNGSEGNVLVTGAGSQWINAGHLNVGKRGNGYLDIVAGGLVSTGSGTLGSDSIGTQSQGFATVTGNGSQWNIVNDFTVGLSGVALLNIEAGGVVNSGTTRIGENTGSNAGTYVIGAGSHWNQGDLYIGMNGDAYMVVDQGGEMNSQNVWLGNHVDSLAQVVLANGSQWNISGDLNVGRYGSALINIPDSVVTVQGRTTLHSEATIHVYGRFDFGTTTLPEFNQINKYDGSSFAGNVEVFGINKLGDLGDFQSSNVDIGDVRIGNRGLIYGDGTVITGINNYSGGEMEILSGERMRFLGNLNFNTGEINNFGGNLRMFGSMHNQAGGLIGGRGEFIFDGGLTNDGILAISGGFADVLGDVNNTSTGVIAVGGGSVTTFYDDVTMDAANMNVDVAADSTAVFFGSYNGGSTGLGSVHVFGDLRPGHSPAVVSFEGDLELAASTHTLIELAGLDLGEFDRIEVGGDFGLDGQLLVETIEGFQLGYNQEFVFAEIGGQRIGEFANFGEGDLVGVYNEVELFMTYQAGDGNDAALFTSVPEPKAFGILCFAMLTLIGQRHRRLKK